MKVDLKPTVSLTTVVSVAEGVISSDLNGEVVILNTKNGIYYGLDEVGHRVWTLVREPMSVMEIKNIILEEYDIDENLCEQDLFALLENLIEEDLVEVRG